MMPEGVEHKLKAFSQDARKAVTDSMMPEGVEHPDGAPGRRDPVW